MSSLVNISKMKYDLIKPWLTLDDWQKEILECEGNICLRSGRQVGKSTVISVKVGDFALKHRNKSVMVIASVERQAQLLFEKILAYIHTINKTAIATGTDRKTKQRLGPTKHKLQLKNGSVIHCLPTGDTGYGIRGYTIDLLVADEAAFIPEDVWTAVTPMLTITKGKIILLSTPHGREGYYYRCFKDDSFKSFHVSSEDCPRKDDVFLEHEKEWMTRAQYAQEYLGEFVDELMQFFPSDLINKICVGDKVGFAHGSDYYMGVDIARMGEDEIVFSVIKKISNKQLIHVENTVKKKMLLTETAAKIIAAERRWNFRKIYIDEGGIGVGVLDMLLLEPLTKHKVIPINNLKRAIVREYADKDKFMPTVKRILKEDLYNNLLMLMERGEVTLLDDPEIKLSLRSIQYEYIDSRFKIHGNYSHIAEALIRACWCTKDKINKLWMRVS